MVDSTRTQHHAGGLRGRPLLSGPVARGSGEALQLRRPGHLDSDRRPPDRRRLRGTCRRLSLHLKLPPPRAGSAPHSLLPKIREPVLSARSACPSSLRKHVPIPSANRQEVFSSATPAITLPTQPSERSQSLLSSVHRWSCAGGRGASNYARLAGFDSAGVSARPR